MTKKTYKELKKQVATLQKQNKMLEEELQRIRLRIAQDPDSNDFDSNSEYKKQKRSKNNSNGTNENEYSEDSSNYSSLADLNADLSQKISDMQKQLSKALLENAKLKKSISNAEAENANLITENLALKWRVESLSKDSDILSEKESEIDSIKSELRKAKNEANQYSMMLKENSAFKQEVVSYHEKLLKHKEELKRAKREIERLNAKNNESDLQIAQMEKSLNRKKEETLKLYRQNQSLLADFERRQINQLKIASIPDKSSSSSTTSQDYDDPSNSQEYFNKPGSYSECQNKLLRDFQEIKTFCTSLRDENWSLKNEIRHLREKLKSTRSYHQREFTINQKEKKNFDYDDDHMPSYENSQTMNYNIRKIDDQRTYNHQQFNYIPNNNNRQICQSKPAEFILDSASKSIISRGMNNFLIKIELLNSKTMTKLDHLLLKWNGFETSLKQAASYRKEKIKFRTLTCNNSNDQFVSNLNRELRIIDTLTRCFAKDHNIPSYAIPNPRQLIGDSEVLGEFLEQKGRHKSRKSRR